MAIDGVNFRLATPISDAKNDTCGNTVSIAESVVFSDRVQPSPRRLTLKRRQLVSKYRCQLTPSFATVVRRRFGTLPPVAKITSVEVASEGLGVTWADTCTRFDTRTPLGVKMSVSHMNRILPPSPAVDVANRRQWRKLLASKMAPGVENCHLATDVE